MEPEKKSNGALIGLVVIIIILIIGGIYMWMSNKNAAQEQDQSQAVTSQDSAALNALEVESNMTDTNTGVDASTVY